MQPNKPNNLSAFEASLQEFQPVAANINRDKLMFEAGVASVIGASSIKPTPASLPNTNGWRITTALAASLVVVFASLYMSERTRTPETIQQIVYVDKVATSLKLVQADSPSKDIQENVVAEDSSALPPHLSSFRLSQHLNIRLAVLNNEPIGYLALREQALRYGVEMLPNSIYNANNSDESSPLKPQGATAAELMEEFLPTHPVSTDKPHNLPLDSTSLDSDYTI